LAATTLNHDYALYNVADGLEYHTLARQPGRARQAIGDLALHPQGRLLAVAIDDGIGFWDIEHDTEIGFLPIGRTTLAFSASGDLFTTWWTRGPYRWRVSTEDGVPGRFRIGPPTRLPLPAGETIAVSGNGRFIGVAHGDGATLLDARQPDRLIHLGPQHDTRFLAISPDSRWAATGSHQSRDGVKVWSLPDGKPVHQVSNPSDCALPLFSPDGRWLVASTAGIYRVHSTGGCSGNPAHFGWGKVFTPDSRLLAVTDPSGSIKLVEPATDRLIATLEDPSATNALSAVFTHDGSRLIYTSRDSLSAHVWDLRAIRRQLAELDLDWDWPRIPEPEAAQPAEEPLRLEIDLGELKGALGRT
jgi:WD40 repeat protein